MKGCSNLLATLLTHPCSTENTGMIAGLGEAARLVVENLSQYHDSMRDVRDYLETQLAVGSIIY